MLQKEMGKGKKLKEKAEKQELKQKKH